MEKLGLYARDQFGRKSLPHTLGVMSGHEHKTDDRNPERRKYNLVVSGKSK